MRFTLLTCLFALLGISCEKQLPPDVNENSSGNPATTSVDYLGAVNKGRKKAITDSALVQVKGALNQFKASNSRPPAFLNELITKGFLRELPELPPGAKWTYDPKTGDASIIPAQ